MTNKTEDGAESQQNELTTCDIPSLPHFANGRQPHVNMSPSNNDECALCERDRSNEELGGNKVNAFGIWNSMLGSVPDVFTCDVLE